MKPTSVPEQALLYYVKKYLDPSAVNNAVHIGRYTADIAFRYKGIAYDMEYDSYSQHHSKTESDMKRNDAFRSSGYTVIRMRDKGLDDLPNCINIRFDFQDYRKTSLLKAQQGISELLSFFGVSEPIDLERDVALFRQMYEDA